MKFKIGDRVARSQTMYPGTSEKFGTIQTANEIFEELEDENGDLIDGDLEYIEYRVKWDEGREGFYSEEELLPAEENKPESFIPEDWS